ncbi:MAG TPA: cytochrome c [Burkholderiales bacterium]|jgi:mono/diheme cytochrome c family protein|nr:cytochrome c [Burkholderiales bacterium]
MAKIEAGKRWTGGAKALVLAALSLWCVLPDTVALAEEEDRPVIKVPRGGGRELFQNCVLCHKYDGRGGPSEGGYGADLRVTKLTKEELVNVITNGRMSKGMPPFKGVLDDEKIETLATFIKVELKLKQ